MNQYSNHELDLKIHMFMKKKMHEFPELKDKHYVAERDEPQEHDRVSRHQLFPNMRFGAQY